MTYLSPSVVKLRLLPNFIEIDHSVSLVMTSNRFLDMTAFSHVACVKFDLIPFPFPWDSHLNGSSFRLLIRNGNGNGIKSKFDQL